MVLGPSAITYVRYRMLFITYTNILFIDFWFQPPALSRLSYRIASFRSFPTQIIFSGGVTWPTVSERT